MDTPAINFQHLPAGNLSGQEGVTSFAPAAAVAELLELKYNDPEFESKLLAVFAVKALSVGALPPGVRLVQELDGDGFYFRFEGGVDSRRHYYHPKGLKEIRVNSQFIDVDLERKWLVGGALAENQRVFKSLDADTEVKALIHYYCELAQLPDAKLEMLINCLHRTVEGATDPYLRIYLADLIMARVLKSLIAHKYKSKAVSVDRIEALTIVETVLDLYKTVTRDSDIALGCLNFSLSEANVVPLSVIPMRKDPRAFWAAAHYQGSRRAFLLSEAMPRFQSETILILVPIPVLLLALADGNRNLSLTEFLGKGAVR
jgi:hypothetical protein